MKKRIAAVACALMMTFSMAVNVMAAPSPTGNRDTSASRGGSSDAPKTGEGDLMIYGLQQPCYAPEQQLFHRNG